MRRWTTKHGADGLRDKFSVYKTGDARVAHTTRHAPALDGYAPEARIGADGEFVFVLRPDTDREAHTALRTYAYAVHHRSPQLSADIHARLDRILDAHSRGIA